MWYWKLYSDEFGEEEFGDYNSKESALEGIKRVRGSATELKDGIIRAYSEPYYKD